MLLHKTYNTRKDISALQLQFTILLCVSKLSSEFNLSCTLLTGHCINGILMQDLAW